MSDTTELGGIGDGHTATSQQVEEELRTSDEIRSSYVSGLTFTNRPVRYSVVEDQAIFEGDILLGTVEEMEQIRRSVEGPRLRAQPAGS
jgi:hypothetical protein